MSSSLMPRVVASSTTVKRHHSLANSLFCLISLFMLLLSLVACDASNTGGKINLTLWYWNRSIDDNLIAQVSKAFPNITLTATKISDYDTKVRTTLAGQSSVPDIVGINSNIATYFPDENQFVDLKTLGANDVQSEYLPWKWELGVAPDGRMIGFPMDTGPTALFYREDLFAKAGLPTDPAQVAAQMKTWDDYLQAGTKLKDATQNKSFMLDNLGNVFTQLLAQSSKQFFDRSGHFIADQSYMKQIWNETAKAAQLGIDAKETGFTTQWNEAASNGNIASFVGAVWMKQILEDAAPNTTGKWRIAPAPGGAGNNGGSFLTVTAASQHPKEAFEVVKWLESPQNQLTAYRDIQLYPSAIAAIDSPALRQKEAFFGGQDTTTIFSASAKNVPTTYVGPYDTIMSTDFSDQLTLIEYQGKNTTQAWNTALYNCQRELLR